MDKQPRTPIQQTALYIVIGIIAVGIVFGLYQASRLMTTKAMETKQMVESGDTDMAGLPGPMGQDTATVELSVSVDAVEEETQKAEETVIALDESPVAELSMAEEVEVYPTEENAAEKSGGRVQPISCEVAHLKGKLLVEHEGQVVKGQRVPPQGSVTHEALKNIRTDVRIVEPGQMITMDYRPDRLTVELDEDGFITNAYCG